MAGASLLMLLDDIASLLDDISLMTKVAARKTASVLGDDLALNAEQVSGVKADRELPVVWAVAKGSFINKAILVPAALGISAVMPWAIVPLLMLGGTYLCFEGAEKVVHLIKRKYRPTCSAPAATPVAPAGDIKSHERSKVKGAIRTDFVLSAEIIVITLGIVAEAPFLQQIVVLTGIAIVMTIGVYGLVAAIVKLDDLGLYLSKKPGFFHTLGLGILAACPYLMRTLAIVGTAAMFLVGGSILVHGVPWVGNQVTTLADLAHGLRALGGLLAWLTPHLLHAVIGLGVGLMVVGLFELKDRIKTAHS
ncbi:DUF808 domain-containing protein [Oceanisphaera avium]|uniref:DUF808 domain-containing protein n=1 Tax=Oceanisphaera avium TaxID=1903694 RepID=A0A1Y0CXX4_9GAMM|nr:DUF808 domain-containing protein [Oceanisphaera avium]ART79874.1 hypothetical protein CBP12_06670 [Oceanisphaera avium]